MRKNHGLKIVFVGGGSYKWCPKLLSDLIQTPGFEGATIVLLDINLHAAREVAEAGKAIANHFRKSYCFLATRDEEAAFRGADFIVIAISTGGFEAMQYDLAIPEKYGIYHTVGDTTGPGGWSRALRNIPVFVRLAQTIERYAPRAVVLNYTNPMAHLTGTFYEVSRLRTVGLCHGVFGTYELLEKLCGVQEKDLCVRFGGVNHFFFILDFAVKGRPGYPLLSKKLAGRSIDEALAGGNFDPHRCHTHHALLDALYRQTGYLGYAEDRHTCEAVGYCLTPTAARMRRFGIQRTTILDRERVQQYLHRYTLDLISGKKPPLPRSRETAVDIMKALMTGVPFCDVANLPNSGQIDNLPRKAVVETLALVNSLGFQAVTTGALPPLLKALVEPHCRCQLMTLEAALTANRELALQALMTDPLCAHLPLSEIRKMGLELMTATRPWLPSAWRPARSGINLRG